MDCPEIEWCKPRQSPPTEHLVLTTKDLEVRKDLEVGKTILLTQKSQRLESFMKYNKDTHSKT
jgi:hypothetical protein